MSVPAMLRRGGALTLLVYAVHTLAAAGLAAPLAPDLARALAQNLYRAQLDAGDAALLAELVARRLPALLTSSAAAALGYALLGPLLRVTWLRAMAQLSPVATNLWHGVRDYPVALVLGAGALLAFGALAGALLLLVAYAPSITGGSLATEHAVRVLCVACAVGAWLLVSTFHDLALSAVAGGAPLRRALASAQRALDLRALGLHALIAVAIGACLALAEMLGRGAAATGPTLVLVLQQSLVFAATVLRAAWLASALVRVSP